MAKSNKYQTIVNAQVRQAMINNGQDPDGFTRLQQEYNQWQEVQKLQGEYDKWAAKQKKKSTTTKSSQTKTDNKYMTAEERKAYKEKTTAKSPLGGIDTEKSYANTYGKKSGVGDSVSQIPGLGDYQKAIKNAKQTEKSEKSSNLESIPKKSYMDFYTEQSLVGSSDKDKLKKYAKDKGISYEEAEKEYQKNRKQQSIVGANSVNKNERLTKQAQEAKAEENRLNAQKKQTAYEAFTGNLAKAMYDVVNGPVYLAGKLTGKNWDLVPENTREEIAQSREQHPTASTLGTMTGMAAAAYLAGGGAGGRALGSQGVNAGQAYTAGYGDALLNGATKEQAIANGLSTGARQLGSNALRNMPVDLAADIIPTLANDVAEGKSKKDIIKNTALNTGLNFGFNALGDLVSLGKAANATKRTVKGVDEVDELVNNATRQANEAIQNIENLKRQIPELELPGNEDQLLYDEIESLNKEMSNMWGNSAKTNNPVIESAAEEVPKNQPLSLQEQLRQLEKSKQQAMLDINEQAQKDVLNGNARVTDPESDLKRLNAERAYREDKLEGLKTADEREDEALDALTDFVNRQKAAAKSADNAIENAAKMQRYEIPEEIHDQVLSDFEEMYKSMDSMQAAAEASGDSKALEKFEKLQNAMFKYEDAVWHSENIDEVNTAKKAADAARQGFIRAMKKVDSGYKGELTGTKIGNAEYRRSIPGLKQQEAEDLANSFIASENYLKAAKNNPEGANPLQFFAEGDAPKEQWRTRKWRTNTAVNAGFANDPNNVPMEDYAYRVFHQAEQHEAAAERYADSVNVVNDLLNTNQFDEVDVKAAMSELQRLLDEGTPESLRQFRRLAPKTAHEGTEGGRLVQAFKEYNHNSASGSIQDAYRMQEDTMLRPWRSRNAKQVEGNRRIAKALADMGNKTKSSKGSLQLTHDQIKEGVIAEIEKEVGSVENLFNDNDIEFLTTLAEDKKIPVWQITSEIEHKLNTGNWYTLDESIPIPKPTNTKLQNALDALVNNEVRAEKEAPSLKQITEEVRNTLAKESADYEGLFSDDDMDYLANLIYNNASKDELAEALNTKMATGSFGISDETMQQVNSIFKRIQNYDPDSKQFVEGQAEAYRLLANEVVGDATPFEKFEAWRYLAMLGNPKTMLRNFIGNQTFGAVTGISNNIAALGEAGVDKAVKAFGGEGIQRTKSVLNPLKDSDLIKAAAEDADASRYRQIVGSKYEKMDKNTLRQAKSVFNSKLLQLYEKATDAGISDYKAVKNKFSTSLAGYLKANGYDKSIFDAETELARLKNASETRLLSDAEQQTMEKLTKDISVLDKARDYALKQAEYATFHEDNAFAKWLSDVSRSAPKPARAMLEGIVPFKKTPANVLRSGLEYSPLGAIDSLKKTGKLIYENTGKRAGNLADTYINSKGKEVARTFANDVIDSWAKTLTGTGLTALGFYLYDKGALLDSDKDTKYQDQLEGLQNYSIKLNDKTYTLDWAAPSVMPLLLGAEIAKVWNSEGKETENWYEHLDEYLNAANRIADPIVETSMLSGIKDTLETAANAAKYDENLNIPTLLAYNTLTGYATQAVPTISGQIARTVDNTRRSTYSDKEGVAGTLEKQGRKMLNKLPGLSMLNQPYIDTYGREQANSPFGNMGANLAYQMFSPGYLANVNTTDADRITRDVYENAENPDENVLGKWKSYVKLDGQRVSPEQYTDFSKIYGQTQYDVRSALANNEWFKDLDNATQTDIMNDINTMSEHVGKAALDPEYITTSKPYTAYKEGGIPGLMNYYEEQQARDIAKESGLSSTSNASKAIQEDVKSGNLEAAQQKVDAAQQLSSLGLEKPGPTYAYYNAQQVIPGLTVERFASTFKNIDTDSNQGIKQDEIIDYCNRNRLSYDDGMKIWKAYGSSKWSYDPYIDESGTWKKSRKK